MHDSADKYDFHDKFEFSKFSKFDVKNDRICPSKCPLCAAIMHDFKIFNEWREEEEKGEELDIKTMRKNGRKCEEKAVKIFLGNAYHALAFGLYSFLLC